MKNSNQITRSFPPHLMNAFPPFLFINDVHRVLFFFILNFFLVLWGWRFYILFFYILHFSSLFSFSCILQDIHILICYFFWPFSVFSSLFFNCYFCTFQILVVALIAAFYKSCHGYHTDFFRHLQKSYYDVEYILIITKIVLPSWYKNF